jgi:uncharacterized coiled-coil protein SlyX
MATDDAERFLRLETKLAYQEKLLAELNEVVLERSQALERLELRLSRLERALREPEAEGHLPHEKPPHY